MTDEMRPRASVWPLLSFLGGVAVMTGEIAAGRLLAPYLGTSTTTWALLIGTVLGSLSLGSLLGGWFSTRGLPERWVVRLLVASSLLFTALPRGLPWLLASSLQRFRSSGVGGLATTALATALILSLPMISLGALSPIVLHAAGTSSSHLGRIAGRISAAGTVGSLVGTFAAGLLLLPWLGTRATFDVAAVLLCSAATLFGFVVGLRREAQVALVATLLALAMAFVPLPSPAMRFGHLLWSGESRYNHLVVVEKNGERQIRLNEGFAVQSFARIDGELPVRDVWNHYALAPVHGKNPLPREALIVGLGGGTVAEVYRRLYPKVHIVGVELDGAIVEAGRRYLGFDFAGTTVIIDDARAFVETECSRAAGRYDVIIIDAFQFPYIPFQLSTAEFFQAVRHLLAPGGVLLVNAGRYGEARGVVFALARTLAGVFAHVTAADAPTPSNTMLVATNHAPSDAVGIEGLDVSAEARQTLRNLASQCAPQKPAKWPVDTPTLTDDRAPIEWLTDRIVWRGR